MPEEINRVVADHISFRVLRAPAHEEVALEFRFEFDGIRAIEPPGFLEFLQLEAGAWRWRTRAGGREETCILLGVTLRENTERPETVDVGPNVLGGC